MPLEEAALESARLRFRPILMTAFAFILGVVPLMLASGAGAGAQNVMGTAVFWGMLVATALGVFIIPGNYTFVESLGRRGKRRERARPACGGPARGALMRRLALIAPALLLAACTVGPDYKRPAVDTPPEFRGATTSPTRALARRAGVVADLPRRDPRRRCIREGAGPATTTCGSRRRASSTRAPRSPSPAPSSSPRCGASRALRIQRIEGNALARPDARDASRPRAGSTLAYELDLWGRFRRGSEAARAELLATEYGARFVITTLVSDLTSAYFLLRALDEELEIARRTLDSRTAVARARPAPRGGRGGGPDRRAPVRDPGRGGGADACPTSSGGSSRRRTPSASCSAGRPPRCRAGRDLRAQVAATVAAGGRAVAAARAPSRRRSRPKQVLAAATARIGVAKSDYFPRVFLSGSVGAGGLMVNGQMFGPQGIFALLPSLTAADLQRGAGHCRASTSAQARAEEAMLQYQQVDHRRASATSRTRSSSTASGARPGSSRRRWRWPRATRPGSRTSATPTGSATYLEVLDSRAPAVRRGAGSGPPAARRAARGRPALQGARRRVAGEREPRAVAEVVGDEEQRG